MKRLTDKHPTVIKLEKLFELADNLGITIMVDRWGKYIAMDNEFPGKYFYIKDSDNNESITQVPSNLG